VLDVLPLREIEVLEQPSGLGRIVAVPVKFRDYLLLLRDLSLTFDNVSFRFLKVSEPLRAVHEPSLPPN
jgi:hypothetical protein